MTVLGGVLTIFALATVALFSTGIIPDVVAVAGEDMPERHRQALIENEIVDLEVAWASDDFEWTKITVVTADDSIVLVASPEAGGDRAFVKAIEDRLVQTVPSDGHAGIDSSN